MSPLINKILHTDKQAVEEILKGGKGIYTFLLVSGKSYNLKKIGLFSCLGIQPFLFPLQ